MTQPTVNDTINSKWHKLNSKWHNSTVNDANSTVNDTPKKYDVPIKIAVNDTQFFCG